MTCVFTMQLHTPASIIKNGAKLRQNNEMAEAELDAPSMCKILLHLAMPEPILPVPQIRSGHVLGRCSILNHAATMEILVILEIQSLCLDGD